MEVIEALECLADGHAVLSEETARQVCEAFQVPFPERRVIRWRDAGEALYRYGFLPYEDGAGSGVTSLGLSYDVAAALGIDAPGKGYIGKGSQARANAQAIRQRLGA